MPFFDPIRIGAAGAADTTYTVDRSLRINNDDSAYLSKTLSSDGNRTTMTLSVWLKRGNFGEMMILDAYENDANRTRLMIDAGNRMQFVTRLSGNDHQLITTGIQRDPSAWYHFVWAIDTTDSTASNRVKMYINGEQQTDFVSTSYPDQNEAMLINKDVLHTIGIGQDSAGLEVPFDGYLAEINFIDGFQYDPSYFGETNVTTGQWNPKEYTGSYGSKGYYLNFSDNSGTTATTLGKDNSGNSNNFTPNNFSVADGIDGDSFADTPTNNFCTLNPLVRSQSAQSLANGNLQRSGNARKCVGTFLLKNNKYYFEVKVEDGNGNAAIGVTQADTDLRDRDNTEAAAYFPNGEYKIEGSGQTSGFSTYGNGDIIGVAIDTTLSTPKVWFAKNNTWQGTGDPSTTGYSLTTGKDYVFNIDHASSGSSTTATAFFGGHKGEFNYTPPTGFVAASSANLPDPTILLPNKHFDTTLYTGNNSSQEISTLNFQPDWLWFKSRSSTSWHALFDSVRGRGQGLASNNSNSEYTSSASNDLVSFDDDGFTLGSNQNWGSVNGSGNSIVTWAWNGGDTDGKTYTVTVVSDSGNKYRFDGFGTSAVTLDLAEGGTYIFDQSDSSNSGHPLRFSTTSDGTHGSGSEYTTGVTTSGTPGSSGAKTTIVVAASAPTLYYYCSVHSGMGGQANTNSTLGSSNFDGTIQSTAKVNANAGFSIITYTGNGSNSSTVGHGLGVTPDAVIIKRRDGSGSWIFESPHTYNGRGMYLNSTNGSNTAGPDTTSRSSTLVTFVDSGDTNRRVNINGETYVMYCFSNVASYSKIGSYTGNGNADGTFVFTGFRPAWIMVKRTDSSPHDWFIWDNKRPEFNVNNILIRPNTSGGEQTYTSIDILSNGFKARSTDGDFNGSGGSIIYLAFAEAPFRNARAR